MISAVTCRDAATQLCEYAYYSELFRNFSYFFHICLKHTFPQHFVIPHSFFKSHLPALLVLPIT